MESLFQVHLYNPAPGYTAGLPLYHLLFILSLRPVLILITIMFDKGKDERVDKLLLY